ncbi:MAG TPA: terpene cyclase/mutase family protein, partial [Thermodesulfobacteriota bacterium]|nr:terpene cyclase/mutase family protein [Thermodesulfobacteriota bacterium]
MHYQEIDQCIKDIKNRYGIEGGFSEFMGGSYRPDATALAILILSVTGADKDFIEAARSSLTHHQLDDGRVSMPGQPGAFWPTSLAIIAWQGSISFKPAQNRAIQFLLKTSGKHFRKKADAPVAHDTSLRGWPWVENTHSFTEPTALAILALDITGQARLSRVEEGIRMLMDRQLPHGGWNYGNTKVYGKELYPFIDTTGVALASLSRQVAKQDVELSIKFL